MHETFNFNEPIWELTARGVFYSFADDVWFRFCLLVIVGIFIIAIKIMPARLKILLLNQASEHSSFVCKQSSSGAVKPFSLLVFCLVLQTGYELFLSFLKGKWKTRILSQLRKWLEKTLRFTSPLAHWWFLRTWRHSSGIKFPSLKMKFELNSTLTWHGDIEVAFIVNWQDGSHEKLQFIKETFKSKTSFNSTLKKISSIHTAFSYIRIITWVRIST